ncbi:carbohydrate kinase family protein [Fulvivirgaceae bacterium PWU4]|uniref:Carbohydrate kinase family protein n=1 Tax=Chryseosolibacter histidini TaxID=2782349 RepID=A0AAP2DI81_9BACT|nr:carbohydrate kinase family protein [Chryseosolibacter histidini]MBT1696858.1 carbohydrate kinase family protein [Chryseosolibacter histidini]
MKRIAIVGPIPRDHIVTHQGDLIQKWGCVTHPVIALSVMAGDRIEIFPVSHVRRVDLDNVTEVFKGYQGVDLSQVTSKNDQGDIISLRFVDVNNRLERQTGFMDPILPEDVEPLIGCDVFVFIPISDYEISLDTLKFLKKKSRNSVIIFDAHGPTTACLFNGERMRKFWVDRDQWLPYIDVLKMNIEEAQASWFKKEYERQDFSTEISEAEMREFASHCLDQGVKCVYITMDSRGCMVYFRQRGKLVEQMVPAVKVAQVIDTTGCGDSFAGGIGFGLLQDPKDYIQAVRYGNALGALRTQGKTFAVFKSLEETNKLIQETYF